MSLAALALLLAVTACKDDRSSDPAPSGTESTESTEATRDPTPPPARTAEPSSRSSRLGLSYIYFDPPDDPELVEEYYAGEAERDGGETVEAPPRPAPGALPGNRSFSIGPPNGGWLINGKAMPFRGRSHRVLPWTQQRGYFWGSDDLVRVVRETADVVAAKFPGSVLRVGNLSGEHGGRIRPSVSHQSGRDVDLGLYTTDLDGEIVDPPGFPKFRDGSRVDTTGRFLFDAARNWALVEALLTDRRARVQWLFLDTPLKQLLLDYAVRTRVSAKLIDRAEKVIVRPKDSSPHADHIHMRIFCSDADSEHGCRDYGPQWQWVKESRQVKAQLLEARVDRIIAGEELLDLMAEPTAGMPTPQLPAAPAKPPPRAMSPDQLRDPPTSIKLKL